jgi:hypothetical protein
MDSFIIKDSQAVFGKDEYLYQSILDDFKKSKFIGIMTFNISSKKDSKLLTYLKEACTNGTNATIITNIPKRFPQYFGNKYALAAKNMIDLYKQQLNPVDYGMRLEPYFTFKNHSKIIMTDNIIYWGSSNFSDESCENFECGTISTDKNLIEYVKKSLFTVIKSKSVPYYKHNFAIAILNLKSLIPACEKARQDLYEAAFQPWSDYDTNFEEEWIYRTTDSGITTKFLEGFISSFSKFEDALNVIDEIVDEYWDIEELPDEIKTLKDLFEEYNYSYENFYDIISSLFEDLKDVAHYDVSEEASRIISNDYAMEAYDEKFDFYAEQAMDEAFEGYEELIKNSKDTVINALESLDCMISYFKKLKDTLLALLEINSKIDNTGV